VSFAPPQHHPFPERCFCSTRDRSVLTPAAPRAVCTSGLCCWGLPCVRLDGARGHVSAGQPQQTGARPPCCASSRAARSRGPVPTASPSQEPRCLRAFSRPAHTFLFSTKNPVVWMDLALSLHLLRASWSFPGFGSCEGVNICAQAFVWM